MFNFLKTKNEKPASDHLISNAYLTQLTEKHALDPTWGTSGEHYIGPVVDVLTSIDARSVLDYGCGKGTLVQAVLDIFDDVAVGGYDPGIIEHSNLPSEPFDLVTCTDVLEHIEPEKINAVLEHIASVTGKAAFFVIHTGPAMHKLPDGRNAHLIQKPVDWWFEKLATHFHLDKITPLGENMFSAICKPWTKEILDSLLATPDPITQEQIEQKLRDDIEIANTAISTVYRKIVVVGMLQRFNV